MLTVVYTAAIINSLFHLVHKYNFEIEQNGQLLAIFICFLKIYT